MSACPVSAALLLLLATGATASAQGPTDPPHVGTVWETRGLGLTSEAFRAIRPGMTLQQVEAIVGFPGDVNDRTPPSGLPQYLWTRPASPESFGVSFREGRAAVSLQYELYHAEHGPVVTLGQYRRLRDGMTYAEVATLFGGPGAYDGFVALPERVVHRYRWRGRAPDSSVVVSFANGRAMANHRQEGLR